LNSQDTDFTTGFISGSNYLDWDSVAATFGIGGVPTTPPRYLYGRFDWLKIEIEARVQLSLESYPYAVPSAPGSNQYEHSELNLPRLQAWWMPNFVLETFFANNVNSQLKHKLIPANFKDGVARYTVNWRNQLRGKNAWLTGNAMRAYNTAGGPRFLYDSESYISTFTSMISTGSYPQGLNPTFMPLRQTALEQDFPLKQVLRMPVLRVMHPSKYDANMRGTDLRCDFHYKISGQFSAYIRRQNIFSKVRESKFADVVIQPNDDVIAVDMNDNE